MSIYDDLPVRESLDGFWSGLIASDAANVDDTVDVIIKSFSNIHRFGPCQWVFNQGMLPERGNECLVVFDEKQRPYVTWWKPTDPNPEEIVVVEVPIGGWVPYGGSSDPSDSHWLLADGRELNRVGTYATLFGVIGTSYGNGNGTSTFNIPNMKGKVPVGLDSAQTEFDTRGETGGAKTHTLSIAEMPAHDHEQDIAVAYEAANDAPAAPVRRNWEAGAPLTGNWGNDIKNTGGGGAHNNLQPYVVSNYIVRVM